MKGKFITFEGSEGSGKSTQIKMLRAYLKQKKRAVLFVREPGGVVISEKIRDILLDVRTKKMGDECETLLYRAARAQLVAEVIAPALKKGKTVLCDRFLDSTLAYQGYGSGVDISMIKAIGTFATRRIKPDLTFVFDLDAGEGLARIRRKKDRIERRPISYHDRVRRGYAKVARQEPGRVKLIDGRESKEMIFSTVKRHIDRLLRIK